MRKKISRLVSSVRLNYVVYVRYCGGLITGRVYLFTEVNQWAFIRLRVFHYYLL